MYWTDAAYTITVNGNPQFQDANPALNIPIGTYLTAFWANNVTNELINLVVAAGLTPSKTDQTQITQAVRALQGFGGKGENVQGADYAMVASDIGGLVVFDGAAASTMTLVPSADMVPGNIVLVRNGGTANVVLAAASGDTLVSGIVNIHPDQAVAFMYVGGGVSVAIWNTAGSTSPYAVGNGSASNHAVALGQFETKARYQFNQSGSWTVTANATQTLATGSITFPAFSKTGAFRVLARMALSGGSSTTVGQQNYGLKLSDGTSTFGGDGWLLGAIANGGAAIAASETLLTSATYAPGSTVDFTYEVSTLGGVGSWSGATVNGSYVELYVVEA